MNPLQYWQECIAAAADECGLQISGHDLDVIADAVEMGHENYGMAFYSPPASDRISTIEGEWKQKLDALQREFDRYRENAEKAVGQALRQHHDASIQIGEHGDVFRYDGRTTQIQ